MDKISKRRAFTCLITVSMLMASGPAHSQFSDFFSKISKGTGELVDKMGSKDNNELYIDRALQKIIVEGQAGGEINWQNPKNKQHGKIRLVSSVKDSLDRPCWKFSRTSVSEAEEKEHSGLVCNTAEDPEDSITANWVVMELKSVPKAIAEEKPSETAPIAVAPTRSQERVASPSRSVSSSSVRNAQQMLNWLGYSVGAPDGRTGRNTRNAILAFQRDYRLPSTGRVDRYLVHHLNGAVAARHAQQQRQQTAPYPPQGQRRDGQPVYPPRYANPGQAPRYAAPPQTVYPPGRPPAYNQRPAIAPQGGVIPPTYASPVQPTLQPAPASPQGSAYVPVQQLPLIQPAAGPTSQAVRPAVTNRVYVRPPVQSQQPAYPAQPQTGTQWRGSSPPPGYAQPQPYQQNPYPAQTAPR